MNSSFKELVLATLKCVLLTVFVSVFSIELEASELNTALTDREQQLLNSAEQKRQAAELIEMMQTLEKLIDYPDGAIDELTGDGASHQSLKRAIRALKKARHEKEQLAEFEKNQQSQSSQQSSCNHTAQRTAKAVHSQSLKPILAIADQSNRNIKGKVIFQSAIGEAISVYEGQSFKYNGGTYQLISVEPTEHHFSNNSKSEAFRISLKTPVSLKHYLWPSS